MRARLERDLALLRIRAADRSAARLSCALRCLEAHELRQQRVKALESPAWRSILSTFSTRQISFGRERGSLILDEEPLAVEIHEFAFEANRRITAEYDSNPVDRLNHVGRNLPASIFANLDARRHLYPIRT